MSDLHKLDFARETIFHRNAISIVLVRWNNFFFFFQHRWKWCVSHRMKMIRSEWDQRRRMVRSWKKIVISWLKFTTETVLLDGIRHSRSIYRIFSLWIPTRSSIWPRMAVGRFRKESFSFKTCYFQRSFSCLPCTENRYSLLLAQFLMLRRCISISGPHTIEIFYDSVPIVGSPFSVNVKRGTDANKCRAYGPGLSRGVINKLNAFTVETKGEHRCTLERYTTFATFLDG